MTASKAFFDTELEEFFIIYIKDKDNIKTQCIMIFSEELKDYFNNLFDTMLKFKKFDFTISKPLLIHKNSINIMINIILQNYDPSIYINTYFIEKKLDIEKIKKRAKYIPSWNYFFKGVYFDHKL